LPILLAEDPFNDFINLMQWIYSKTGQTHQINLKKLYELVAQATHALHLDRFDDLIAALEIDYANSKLKGHFKGLRLIDTVETETASQHKRSIRQQRHLG